MSFDGRTRLEVMVEAAIERLRMFEPPEGYYLAFSGGKDSQCVYHLAKEAGVKFDAHYNITGIDPPELVYHIRQNYADVQFEPYRKSMWQLIRENRMPPTRIVRFCCRELKERGGTGRIMVSGIRAAESPRRRQGWGIVARRSRKKRERTFAFDPEQGRKLLQACPTRGTVMVAPIYDWDDSDVWAYLRSRDIKTCSLYDEGFKRLGCIGCPMAPRAQRERQFIRWPKFKAAYLKTFEAMLRDRRERRVWSDSRYGWKTAEEVFDWWMRA